MTRHVEPVQKLQPHSSLHDLGFSNLVDMILLQSQAASSKVDDNIDLPADMQPIVFCPGIAGLV